MSEVTRVLAAIEEGDPHAAEQLLPLVYDELRKLAAQRLAEESQHWDTRRHFFAAVAEAMRRILLDRARDKRRLKRGGNWRRLRLDQIDLSVADPPDDL